MRVSLLQCIEYCVKLLLRTYTQKQLPTAGILKGTRGVITDTHGRGATSQSAQRWPCSRQPFQVSESPHLLRHHT